MNGFQVSPASLYWGKLEEPCFFFYLTNSSNKERSPEKAFCHKSYRITFSEEIAKVLTKVNQKKMLVAGEDMNGDNTRNNASLNSRG